GVGDLQVDRDRGAVGQEVDVAVAAAAGAGLLRVLPGLPAVRGVPELDGGVVTRVVAGRADDAVPAVLGPGERRLAVGRAAAHTDGGEAEPPVGRRTVAG